MLQALQSLPFSPSRPPYAVRKGPATCTARRAPNHPRCRDVCSRAHLEHNLVALHYIVPRWRRSPATFTVPQCASSSPTSSCIHHLSRTRNPFLSCNRTTDSFTAANTCAHFVYPHCNPKLPLHWPRWFASDTRTHFSPDSATFTKDDPRTPPLLLKHLAFTSPPAAIIWPSS